MTRRRFDGDRTSQPSLTDQYDCDIDNLRGTIRALGDVSTEIGKEIDKQNNLLDKLNDDFEKGMIKVNKLVEKVKEIFIASGMSPMTMTLLFIFAVILFLWLYWKWYA
ncbi:hypothetical protein M9Y10_039236 [Tritrichomonas musculus]|uniref:t-SNARE coiled-coil homology domain-containing protein n=1 Tax=Tritrichomonas musculus TaxID=1915356 RepID=A0ABR2KAL5_9EUKA